MRFTCGERCESFRKGDGWRIQIVALALIWAVSAAGPTEAQDLGNAQLLIAGTRLTVSPEAQTVPFDTPTVVNTQLEGYDAANGMLPPELRVVADFTGPGIDGVLPLSTRPNEPFRIPRLTLKGQYQLDNIRLVHQGETENELLAYAEPRSAGVLVTQVLVTRVTSRALTLDEIRNYGIVVDDDSFKAFNFTFGFGVDGDTFDYNVPVLFNPGDAGDPQRVQFLFEKVGFGRSWGTTSTRFRPPQIAPFTLELQDNTGGSGEVPVGGCLDPFSDCRTSIAPPIPGVVLFPTDVAMLHQFFSVMVLAKNDAPAGDPLVIRDLTAKMVLPPGLRQAETEPPTPLGVPIPVRVPGPDGRLGTGDDISFLVAQATGQAEALVEGRQEGVQIVEFQLEGVLDGLPDGQIRRVEGSARGAVLVRDATLGVTISHPDVVRTDEEYSLLLTVSNTSVAPANLISFTLPVSGLSGVTVVGETTKSIASLLPGESEVVEFRLRSQRTGRVFASSARSGSEVSPSFELTAGVGENDIPLAPTSIILPRQTESLPPELNRRALALVGLAFSLATAPASELSPSLPQIVLNEVDEKVYWFGQMGRHVSMGEDLFDAAAVFAAEWHGVHDHHWEWDELRRTTEKGALLADELGGIFAQEAAATSALAVFDRHTATTAYLGPMQGALAAGTGAHLEVASRTSGLTVSGVPTDTGRIRDLAFAELYDLGGAEMVTLAVAEDNGYQARLTDSDGGTSELHLRVPDEAGALRRVSWSLVSLSPGGIAVVDFDNSFTDFTLFVDTEGDGVVDEQIPGTVQAIQPRAFTALAAVQNPVDPSGHLVEVLLTQDIDLVSLLPRDPQRFTIPGKVSNGGLIPSEEGITQGEADRRAEEGAPPGSPLAEPVINPFAGLRNSRIVRVVFNNPISPYLQSNLTVRDLQSMTGQQVLGATLPVQTTVADPGGLVQGTVIGPDGQPVPFARVDLFEVDSFPGEGCGRHRTASVQADAAGSFLFDYVRQTTCSDIFTLAAQDPESGAFGTARGRIRTIGGTAQLDIVMLGRGTVRGRVTYEDGTVPASPRVIASSPVFSDGREARVDANGFYEVDEIPVGTVTLGAADGEGNFVYQTVEIPTAGAVTERNLVIIRRPPDLSTGDVRGTVYESDGVTPLFDAYVALHIDGELVGVRRSALDGSFDFGTVPTGGGEIEAFDGQTGLLGAQILFEVLSDQVNDIPVLLQDDRGVVEGHVLRQTNEGTSPVAGAVVWAQGTPFNTVTDAQGFYRLEGVFAGTRTILAADVERQVQTSASVSVNPDGSTVTRDLIFFDTSSVIGGIAGEVLGFNGSPVSATLHLAAPGDDKWWGTWSTGVNGTFFIPELGPGTYEVHAIAGGGGAKGQVTIRFKGETPFVTLRLKKGTIKGVARAVNESGELIGVKSVVTYRTTTVWQELVILDKVEHALETNADGTFEIPNALVGPYVVTVHNAFYGEKTIRAELFFHGEVQEHEVVFESNGTIRGRVLDWDGQTPVEGATVNLRHPNFSIFDLTTDSDGRFVFDLVPPEVQRFPIDAEIDDGITYRTARVWVRFDRYGQELDVELVLQSQGTVSGFVEDANGVVVPGAVVTLREHGFPGRRFVQNADGEGFFSFRNVFIGRVSLSAKAPSLGGLSTTTELSLSAEGEAGFAVLTLEATGEIVGTVLSPVDGLPVPSVQVGLYQWGRGLFDAVTADQFGKFRFDRLPLAQYRILVFDPRTGRYGLLDGVWIEFNDHVRDVEVQLEVRGDVDGHLREPGTETPVPAATVRLVSYAIVPFTTYSSTDVEGYFEFLGIPEGTFSLRSKEPEGRRRASGQGEITMEGQRVTVDLYLEDSGTVTGSVLNPPGLPAGLFPNVNTVIRQDGTVIGATLDNPFTFTGVIADRPFELLAVEMGGDHEGIASGMLTTQGEVVTVDVPIKPIGGVGITVTDSFGNPVSGADVKAYNRTFYGRHVFGGGLTFTGSTDAAGRVVFQGVGEGSVSVSATNPLNNLRGSAAGEIEQDAVMVEIPIQLQDSGDIVGRALLSDGLTPAEGALVVATIGGRTYQTFADPNGDFSFTAVPMGSFQLYVTEADSGPGQIERSGALATNGEVVDFGVLVLDDVNPAVVSFDPVPDSRDLLRTTAVTVVFSEPLDLARASSSWFSFKRFSGGGISYTLTWPDDTTAVLTPNNLLDNFTGYQVIVKDAVDLAGRRLSNPKRTLFYTRDSIPPTVIEFDPRPDENQVPVTANILVTFSEPVEPTSLSFEAFQLTDLQTGVGVTTTHQQLVGERKVRLTPASGLLSDRQYQLTVQDVRDGSGNTMTTPVTTTFWTVDTIPPDITSVSLSAGTSYTSGEDIPVTVEATDLWGVASVTAKIDSWSFPAPAEPWSLTAVAPYRAVTESVPLIIEAVDIHGNVATQQTLLQISPRVNASAPVLDLECIRDGGVVVPGFEVETLLRVTDDEAVESLTFSVDGVEQDRVDFVNLPSTEHSFFWMPPSGALAGDSFTLRVETRDFAGNVSGRDVVLAVPMGTILVAGRSLFNDYAGQDLVLTGGTFLARESLDFASLTVVRNTRLVSADGVTDLSLRATGDVTVQCGAELSQEVGGRLELRVLGTLRVEAKGAVSGWGYAGGTATHRDGEAPAWVTSSTEWAGGSHGGVGSVGRYGTPGELYGSVYRPREAGGGGGSTFFSTMNPGGAGGGALDLVVGTLDLRGAIRVRGEEAGNAGGGAGGSLLIQAGTLGGPGEIDARGADGPDEPGGAGGGGRVALVVDAFEGFDPLTQVKAWGGVSWNGSKPVAWGTPGTVFVKLPTHTTGDLILDAGTDTAGLDLPAPVTPLPELGEGAVVQLEVSGADAWVTGDGSFLPRWEGVRMVLQDATGGELGAFEVVEIDTAGRVRLAGAGTVTGTVSYRGEYRFDAVRLLHGAGLDSVDPLDSATLELDGEAEVPPNLTTGTLSIAPGAVIRPARGLDLVLSATGDLTIGAGALLQSESGGVIDLWTPATLTVEAGAVLEVSGLGYAGGVYPVETGGAPAWVTAAESPAGGGHGGGGGTSPGGAGVPGAVFDSVYWPQLWGGGGAADVSDGGAGGGVVVLDVGTLDLSGEIRALGAWGSTSGGSGAGGTVRIEAGTVRGTGSIDASGAPIVECASTASQGTGGGGRVAIYADLFENFDPASQVKAWGGEFVECGNVHPGGASGTVYVKQPTDTYGRLWIDQGVGGDGLDRPGAVTELPELGTGSVTAFEVSGLDAWVSGAAVFTPRWWGAWMVVVDAAGTDLGAFKVVEIDATGRVRLAGAGAVTGAATYGGEYRFDTVDLLHGAGIASSDFVEGTVVVGPGQPLIEKGTVVRNLVIESGATITPADGVLILKATGSLTLETGAVLDVSHLGYGSESAPPGVTAATTASGGSHGGFGAQGQLSNTPGVPGEVYDSVYWPELAGGGGSGSGKAGGGVVLLEAGTLVLDGEIRALGESPQFSVPAGAGGTVQIQANTLRGTGSIDVSGGDTLGYCDGYPEGAGGGGRVAIHTGVLELFDPASQVNAMGGLVQNCNVDVAFGGPGTVFVKTDSHTYGDLWISQTNPNNVSVSPTQLPEIHKGIVGAIQIDSLDPTDLWIGPTDPAKLHSLGVIGMWVRIGGVDYPVLDESADRRRLLLDGAAGSVEVGDTYLGVYKFDTVTVAGTAGLVINDATDDVGQFVVDPGASLQVLDVFPPSLTVTDPPAGSVFAANQSISVAVDVSDDSPISQVSFELGTSTFVDVSPPWVGTVVTPDVSVSTGSTIHIEATDSEGNVGLIDHPVTVDPAVVVGTPPEVAVDCPTSGVRVAPGTGLQVFASASHTDGVDRLEVLLGDDPMVLDTDFTAPYQLRFDVPVTAVEGDVLAVTVRAWSSIGSSADAVLSIPVVEGAVLTTNTYLGPGDTSLDGGSVIVTGGAVLTVEGPHTFRDLIVLDGGGVDHPVSTASATYTMDLDLTRDLIVGCGGVVDATGHGLPGGVVPYGSAAAWVGATHAGQGGLFNGAGRIYGNLFDPSDPGGGGGTGGGAGGGVIRIAASGQMVIDGQVSAAGVDHASTSQARGAGGSIRLDAVSILGSGVIDASGGGGPNVTGSGSGGRVALYGGSIDTEFVDRSTAAGGESYANSRRGAAGTIYVKLDSQVSGDLILDNAGQISDHYTEIPSAASGVAGSGVVGSGVVDSVTATSITDLEASFPYSLVGAQVAFNGDRTTLWSITGPTDGSPTLDLDTGTTPLSAVTGDTYEILYRFDRVVVRNGARGITLSDVLDATPEVDGTSSWTSGYQPSLTVTQPVAGTQLTAGQSITFEATVADVFGLATAVSFTFNGETKTDSTAPYQATYFVPPATVASTIPISVTATDRAGHALEHRPSFDWLPSANSTAPTVMLDSGPVEGEVVEAGRTINLAYTATDDELLYSRRFLVDGAVQSETTQVNQASVTSSYSWMPPGGAAPGTMFTLRIEAEDFAANVGVLQRTVVISDPALSGDQSLDSTYNGQDLLLGAGTFTVIEPISLGSLRLLRDARVMPDATGRLDLTVTGELRVQDGAFIDATGLGYAGGTSADPLGGVPSWVTGPSPDAGGAHGGVGVGWNVLGPSGEEYDSVYVPDLPGGGGSQDNDGSGNGFPGGGVVVIDAGSVVLDGEIRARGKDYNNVSGGGSAAGGGGSVRLRAGSLSGTGLLDASGGFSNGCLSSTYLVGPGGGGRVALDVDSLSGFDVATQVRAWGGALWWCSNPIARYAAPGTIFVRTLSSTYGDLRIDPGTEADGSERTLESTFVALPELGSGTVTGLEVSGSDLWVTSDLPLRLRWLGAWMVLEDTTGADLGTYEVVALDGTTRALLAGAAADTGAVSYRGEYRFDQVDVIHGLGLASSDVIRASGDMVLDSTTLVIPPTVIAQNLRIAAGSTVTVVQGDRLELSVPGTLTVEAGAVLDLSGLGYAGGTSADPIGGGPSWVTGPSPDAGGAHGGVGIGWNVIGPSGEEYDSVYVPDLSGGGGSQDNDGSGNGFPGGGVLVIDAGSVVLDGEIRARGKDYNNVSGGGSAAGGGGSVRLRAGSLSGTGLVDASGGFSNGCLSSTYLVGPGGGGRVALDVDSLSGFDVASQVRTWGGALWWCSDPIARYAAPGTIFVRTLSSTYGDLRVDAGTEADGSARSLVSTHTALPALGSGTLTGVEVSGLDLWVTSEVPLQPRWVGAWMVLEDVTRAELGAYEVMALDGTTRALLAGAASETGAVTFRGEYRFDRLDLLNGLGLVSSDVIRVAGDMVVDSPTVLLPPSTVVAQNLRIASGSTATVVQSDRLELSVPGTLTVETGAVLDVSGLGYPGGTSSQPSGGAPPNVTGPAPDAGGGHGGFGVGWNVAGPSGEIYDSVFAPDLPGVGGSQDNDGTGDGLPGGGVVVIEAGSVVLDGEIRARGTDNDNASGGGSAAGGGGSIRIQASSLTGTGLVDVSGGFSRGCSSSSAVVGPGGGGRVALLVDSLVSFDAATQVRTHGGARSWCSDPIADYAGPGTVYVLETTDSHGHLIVDQAGETGKTVPTTFLPSPGTGTVGVATPDATTPADLWVEPQDPLALLDLGVTGMWLRIAGNDYRILDQTSDRRQVLLEGAAGIVSVGDTYQGVYKLDTVTARGGTILEFLDTAEIGTLDVDADSQVITP